MKCMYRAILFFAVTFLTSVYAYALDVTSAASCIKYPSFTKSFGFNPQQSYLNTSEVRRRGLVLVEKLPDGSQKVFQHLSWLTAGSLGGMIFDDMGNVFTFPAPHVELTYNPHEQTNTIFKVDKASGEMVAWSKLPKQTEDSSGNPYGIIGLAYSCFNNLIYVSSVYGTKRLETKGSLYIVDPISHAVIDSLPGFDGFGLAVVRVEGKSLLLMGSARDSELYALPLGPDGRFLGRPYAIGSIRGLGPRGADKIKKIAVDASSSNLVLTGFEFDFNLTSTLERQESQFKIPYKDIFK